MVRNEPNYAKLALAVGLGIVIALVVIAGGCFALGTFAGKAAEISEKRFPLTIGGKTNVDITFKKCKVRSVSFRRDQEGLWASVEVQGIAPSKQDPNIWIEIYDANRNPIGSGNAVNFYDKELSQNEVKVVTDSIEETDPTKTPAFFSLREGD
jgi:hypothetical protein